MKGYSLKPEIIKYDREIVCFFTAFLRKKVAKNILMVKLYNVEEISLWYSRNFHYDVEEFFIMLIKGYF